ncbi:MAG: L-serine ammonia-lyase, iron-sulfur-dependent, subunit alpha [Methanobacterium sp.]
MEEKKFLEILNKELVVSLGCTEPIAIAFAAALARKHAKGNIVMKIKLNASKNIIKNAMSVNIPGTHTCGIDLAAALGVITQNPEKNLELLTDLKLKEVENAKKMVQMNIVTVELADSVKKLYIEVFIQTEISNSRVIIEDKHDNVVMIEVDGKPLKNKEFNRDTKKDKYSTLEHDYLSLNSILEFIQNINVEKLGLIKKSVDLNMEICLEGLKKPYGLGVGRSIKNNMEKGFLGDNTSNYAIALTAAGSDARMAGSSLPVMSNSGSGNQGISTTIPVVVFAEYFETCEEELIRAVTLSNLVTIYIKLSLGRLSALCGASISAAGACCGIMYLMGADESKIKLSIQNMIGNLTGMICDGAKAGCALKIATCTSAAIQSAILTLEGNTLSSSDGIIGVTPEKTIENFCLIGNEGMIEADQLILEIMLKK